MSSDEKLSPPVLPHDSDRGSSVSSELQEEYEELLRYAIVTPNIESSTLQSSHPKEEVVPDVRVPTVTDDILHNQEKPVVKETGMDVGNGCDLNVSIRTKTDGLSPVSSPRKPTHPVMDFFSSHLLDDSSSPASVSSHATDLHEVVVNNFLISDENLQKMENVLDLWSSGLKTNVISELSKWRLNFVDWHRMEMRKEKEKHAAQFKQLYNQISDLKELQKAYEVSTRRKDEVISSLSQAIGKQKERIELVRTFFHWRIGHVKSRQDIYESKLADQHFRRTLLKKVWKAWHSTIQRQWKEVVERACQARAEEVCVQISNDYENKVAMLSGALENAKAEIQRMQHEKEHFEDSMKKAFMRGVCALNLEAMTIFQNRNDAGMDSTDTQREDSGPGVRVKEPSAHVDLTVPLGPSGLGPPPRPPTPAAPTTVGTASAAAAAPSAASVTSAGTASAFSLHMPVPLVVAAAAAAPAAPEEMYVPRVVISAQQKAGRTITARVTGKCDFASKNRISSGLAIMGVSPPMSSVVVEKHHPVTMQTIPQATAAKYPRAIHHESSTSAARSLGARSAQAPSLTSIHSIKVVD
ncbi:centrosomal protein POC5 isoform X2 [Echinops telfairi]|uniref:Centrosomal protein POC5 isoform X2 n=1 Tax=Echinops telfairi TaxID=9371 RepID=A0AC55CR40_ECHTE|nr:centrosomal protein POC5 isoform X2 [Echinops telfairi]